MKQPIKMTPGDELHLTALMAPFSLNLVNGPDRQHLLGYGRAAFDAGKDSAGKCLHQIQDPAPVQAAKFDAGISGNKTTQAVPELQDLLRELRVQISKITAQLHPSVDCSGVWMAHDKIAAALATTPAADAPVVIPRPQHWVLETQAPDMEFDYTGVEKKG